MKSVVIPEDLQNSDHFRSMSRWFSPRLLWRVIQKVFASTLFGQYADRRVTHAALDQVSDEIMGERCGIAKNLCRSKDGATWVDYVADLGDGFDSTYAIAYLLGQAEVEVNKQKLPRADCLIMGGDQVYPDASRDDYWYRMQMPYEAAFPRTDKPDADHPPVFLIPGNHDWYDGLTLFLAKFCRGRDTYLGSWVARQSRSYFAVRVIDDWWIWGFDSQLGEDLDMPQANYFVSVARQMKSDAKVILCASTPSWLHADEDNEKELLQPFKRGIDYISNILKDECPGAKIPLVLSGDLHHYSRYQAQPSGTNFIGAGGGGAFLHPTHTLPASMRLTMAGRLEKLNMPQRKLESDGSEDVCYPTRGQSRRLSFLNLLFLPKNLDFCVTLGLIYWAAALLLLAFRGYGQPAVGETFVQQLISRVWSIGPTPVFLGVAAAFCFALIGYADVEKRLKKIVGGVHALLHIVLVLAASAAVSVVVAPVKNLLFGDILYFFSLGIGMLGAGAIGGVIWGLYLLFCSVWLDGHANDAFSAMRLDSYRHFLRMKIEGSKLTIFPIGIDRSPDRSVWKKNEKFRQWDQKEPFFVPSGPLGQKFIEDPIVIDAGNVLALGAKPGVTPPAV